MFQKKKDAKDNLLLDVSRTYGTAGQSGNQDLKDDPFGEDYQEDTDFWLKVRILFDRKD